MYSIGEFSKINRITPKTLRHYDKLGLLRPEKTDGWTGYRYYSAAQLVEIRRILMFRDMGFSLPEIRELLQREDRLSGLLEKRARELSRNIAGEQARLERVRGLLESMKGEQELNENVILKSLPEVIVASMRTTVDSYDDFFTVVPRMGDYMGSVGAVCRVPEYCFTIYHNGEYRETDIDVEICEAVEAPCAESDRIRFKTVPGVPQAACLMHRGPYSTLRDTYNALYRWIDVQGYRPADPPRESYIDGIWNREDPEDWLTEVQVPVVYSGKEEAEAPGVSHE